MRLREHISQVRHSPTKMVVQLTLVWTILSAALVTSAQAVPEVPEPVGQPVPQPAQADNAAELSERREAVRSLYERRRYPTKVDIPYHEPENGAGTAGSSSGRGDAQPRRRVLESNDRRGAERASESRPDTSLPDWLNGPMRALGNLLEGIARLFAPLGQLLAALPWWAIGIGVLVLLGLVIGFFIIRNVTLSGSKKAQAAVSGKTGDLAEPMWTKPTDPLDLLIAEERWREAVHLIFLETLDECGFVPTGLFRAYTHREATRWTLANKLAHSSDAQRHLDALHRVTEVVWFGTRGATKDDFDKAMAARLGIRSVSTLGKAA